MEKVNFSIKEPEDKLPENSGLIIGEIIKKYDLEKIQNEGINLFFRAKTPEEREKILINLPGAKISKLVREYAEGRFNFEVLPEILEKHLKISSKKAKQMADDLKIKLFVFISPATEKTLSSSKIPSKEIKPPTIPHKKPETPQKSDTYREPIE